MKKEKRNFTDYVYLSELDSVKKSYDEQMKAEKALFHSLVYEGKAVVLTYNQIVDSITFLHCIKNEEAFKTLLSYFKDKRLLVNQYEKDMNLSKYIQNNYHQYSSFQSTYFAFLDKYNKEDRITVFNGLCESIQYGDSLFLKNVMPDAILDEDQKDIYQYIHFILKINSYMNEYECYVYPKKRMIQHRMSDYMQRILLYLKNKDNPYALDFEELLIEHFAKERKDSRSEYLITLNELDFKEKKAMLTEFIHLAYNLTLEASIPIIHRRDHLKSDLKTLLNQYCESSDEKIAPVKCHWKDGYRMTTITAHMYDGNKKRSWKHLLWLCPFVELAKIIISLIFVFAVTMVIEQLSVIQTFWEAYPFALLFTFTFSIFIDEILDILFGKLSKWLYTSGFKEQFRNFGYDIHILFTKGEYYHGAR